MPTRETPTPPTCPYCPIDFFTLDSSVSQSELGSLFRPWENDPIGDAHRRIAAIYGVPYAFISTNGTTTANKLALYTLVGEGDEVIVERDCHVSVVQTLNEIGATPRWLMPPFDEELGVNLCSTPEQLTAMLDAYPRARAVHLTSPKYFGITGDIARMVQTCHERGVRVLVDEAHGACIRFHPQLPTSATASHVRADIVTQSTHKTTEALSQGSILLLGDEALKPRFLHALQGTPAISTSFLYPLLLSVERAIEHLVEFGESALGTSIERAQRLRDAVNHIDGLRSWGAEKRSGRGDAFRELDPLRVTVDVSRLGRTGWSVEEVLHDQYGITVEFGDARNVLVLITTGTSDGHVTRLVEALRSVAAERRPRGTVRHRPWSPPRVPPEQVATPRAAFWHVWRGEGVSMVPVDDAVGRISGETIAVYPPGNALIVHGERITDDVVRYLRDAQAAGAHLKGASDPEFASIIVIDSE